MGLHVVLGGIGLCYRVMIIGEEVMSLITKTKNKNEENRMKRSVCALCMTQ